MTKLSPVTIVSVMALGLLLAGCKAPPTESQPPEPRIGETPPPRIPALSEAEDRVYFGYDSAVIAGADNLRTVEAQAAFLKSNPTMMVTIEGHADERGTREYNLALGERRAVALREALTALGVAPSRITVISYGKERPAVAGSTESAWRQNRRAVTVTR